MFESDTIHKIAIWAVPVLLSLTVHEFAHARSAWALGDGTARAMGRMTLNPIAHMDIFGTVIFPLLAILFGMPVFGWARPVPVNPFNFRRGIRLKHGMLLVAAAGPGSNLAMALIATFALFAYNRLIGIQSESDVFFMLVMYFISINVYLALFNLIPMPPLDGSRIMVGLLPDHLGRRVIELERYSFILLFVLLFSGAFRFIARPAMALIDLLLGTALGV